MVAKNKNKIVIRLDADHHRGMGHLYRMLALADRFAADGIKCTFVLRTNEVAAGILLDKGYDYRLYPANYSEESIIGEDISKNAIPELWIFDVLSTSEETIECVKKRDVPVVCFDDMGGGLAKADVVINAIIGISESQKDYPANKVKVLNGADYIILNPDILKLSKQDRLIWDKLKVAITMGGSDTYGTTVKLARVLSEITTINLEVVFFLGPHFQHNRELENVTASFAHHCTVKRAVKNLHANLLDSDVVICGGGQTLFELCYLGFNILALANEVHEEKTIEYLSRHNACINIGSIHKEVNSLKIAESLTRIYHGQEKYKKLRDAGKRVVDGKGVIRCYGECVKLVNRVKI